MNIIVHRGTQQIGGTCIELSTKNTRLLLDIGQELPPLNEDRIEPKMPLVKGLYHDDIKAVDAILVSHGHGDHIGLVEHVHPEIPIYIGEKALRIYNVTAQFTGRNEISNPVTYLVSGKELKIGDFSVTPYLVDHSGFDSYAFLIKAGGKFIAYTGDFREHGRKKPATGYFKKSIPSGIDALLIEGTMMSRINETVETEEEIEQKAFEFMSAKDKPIFVLQSSTNIDRLVGMYKAAKQSKRIFVIDIYTAHVLSQLQDSIPQPDKFKDIKVFYPRFLTNRMFETENGAKLMKRFNRFWIGKEELGNRNDFCMLIRGSMLYDLQGVGNLHGSGLIYSLWSGYRKTHKVKRLLDYASSISMEIIDLHTSGHASMETIQDVIDTCKPKKIIPVHTEEPELFAGKFPNAIVAKDGEAIIV
ncbi:MAG: MBL fold metallo-hydrolase [Dethiobacter sp.]|nr:MBL fold metallo-hydrolase [Dethiobacter sp.]